MPLPPEAPEAMPPIRGITADPSHGEAAIQLPCTGPAAEHACSLLRDCGVEAQPAGPLRFASPALEWATCGAMSLTGRPDGPPRFAAGALASAARGAGLALAGLAPDSALTRLDAPALLGERAAIFGLSRDGTHSAGGGARLLATREDWVVVSLPRPEDWELVPAWLEDDAGIEDLDWERVARALSARDAADVVARGRLMGLAIAPAPRRVEHRRPWLRISQACPAPAASRRAVYPPRVLDLSSLWAGPLAASLLATAGCEVLKLESPSRPDGARRGPRDFFDLLNGGKRGCALDPADPHDRERFEELLEGADIVLESARPRALEQLGYDAAGWVAARPGRIWASITGYGREGPQRDWIAFGDDAAVAAGLAWPVPLGPETPGPGDDLPCFCADAIADPLTGLHAAVAILGCWRAGCGGLLDLSLVDITAHAASLEAAVLGLPIETGPRGWSLVVDGRRVAVEPPRARRAVQRAPALARPSAAPGGLWTRRC